MPVRLLNLFVKSVSLVKKPSNRRQFVVVKAEGRQPMRAKTYEECLTETQATRSTPVAPPTLTKADLDHFNVLVADALRGVNASKATRSATDEAETRIAARIDRNPVSVTRAEAMQEVFSADPALYDRYRRENTIGRDGQPMSADQAFRDVGVGRVTAKSDAESAAAEVERCLDTILAKESRLTRAQAAQFLFRQDPALYARWQREAYA